MEKIYSLFTEISKDYGDSIASLISLVGTVGYVAYFLIKTFQKTISKIIEKKYLEKDIQHEKATKHRKNITPEIRNELANFAKSQNLDRVLLFEYSNGTSNIVGLPFLYVTVSSEVIRPTISPVAQHYQRLSTGLISEFLEKLESKGFDFIEDLESVKDECPMIYYFLKPCGARSVLFYSVYGVDKQIGFILAMSTDDKIINKKESLPQLARSAQKISALMNLDKLNENLK